MYGLGGNTTRVSQTDVNLINSFCVQGIIRGSLEPSLILTHQHLKQMFSLWSTLPRRRGTYQFLRGRRTRCPHSLLPYRRMPP